MRDGTGWPRFGKLMRSNADYLIHGSLVDEVRLPEYVGGKQVTFPLRTRAWALTGSLFFAGKPASLTFVRD